jgi:DNA-binding IclR family transcriptional regulator
LTDTPGSLTATAWSTSARTAAGDPKGSRVVRLSAERVRDATTEVSVKSADRVLLVFDYLAEHGPATFSAIATALGLPNSSAHNLLRTMARRGYIEFDRDVRVYRLGLRLWQVGQAYPGNERFVATAQPLMDRLMETTGETVQLARLDGIENVYLAIAESPHPMKLVSAVGKRLYAHATGLGKVLLAALDEQEARRRLSAVELPRFTPNTIVDVDELIEELARVHRRGYALDAEEYVIGCRCIAMPIRSAEGAVIASMSVSIPTPRYNAIVARRVRAALADTVAELSRRLGYQEGVSDRRRAAER